MKKIFAILLVIASITTMLAIPASAASYDTGATGAGYYVDLDAYNPVIWYNRVSTNVSYNGTIIGTSEIDIGVTRALSKSGSYYIDSILTRTSMKGKGSGNTYGYADYLQLSSTLNSDQILWGHDPKQEADEVSYTIGLNVGGSVSGNQVGINGGISASQTFTEKALTISDLSDPSSRYFGVKFDYKTAFWRWHWDNYNVYAYNYSEQLASYQYKTTSSRYSCKLTQQVQYEVWDDVPKYWASDNGLTSRTTCNITFTSAY